jgi:hypothetical protein
MDKFRGSFIGEVIFSMKTPWNFLVKIDPVCWAVLFITCIGAYPRLFYAGSTDFPLNDGGLFLTMIQDLEKTGYAIPVYASYNSSALPFAYPPLGFFLTSFLSRLLNRPLLDILRLLPAVLSILTIPAFFMLSHSILKGKVKAVYATFAFALLPTSYDWMIMGGGITRSLGFFLTILLLLSIQRYLESHRTPILLGVTLLVFLLFLSHIGVAWFAAYSACFLIVSYKWGNKAIWCLILAAIGGALLASPWFLTVVFRHGLTPFLSAGQNIFLTGTTLAVALGLMFTNEPVLDLLAVMGFIGSAICIRDRKFHLVVWLGIIIVFQGRFWQVCAIVPFAMLAGIGIDSLIHILNRNPGSVLDTREVKIKEHMIQGFPRSLASRSALGYVLLVCFVSAILAAPKEFLSQGHRDAMQWIAANTPPESSFIVISGIESSGLDYISEWFPAIGQRISIGTPQGYEWMGEYAFDRHNQLHSYLQKCETISCLDSGVIGVGNSVDYIYLVLPEQTIETRNLLEELLSSTDFVVIYRSSEAIIFYRKE